MSSIVAWTGLFIFLVLPKLLTILVPGIPAIVFIEFAGGIIMAVGIALMWAKK